MSSDLLLDFDAEDHVYRLHRPETPASWGQVIPSVTQALTAAALIEGDWYTERARERGRFVHKAIFYEEREGLNDASLDERLVGYVAAYRAFIRDVRPGPCLLGEAPLADPVLRFAGTLDQVRSINQRIALIDHKTGAEAKWHGCQLAAYQRLTNTEGTIGLAEPLGVVDRYVLYLRPNGQYRLVQQTDRADWKVFAAALTIAHFKEKP